MTWIEIADTAVKIGLSGIIVAISGYVLTRKNQKHDFDKEFFRRRQDVIERVSASFENIHAFFFNVCIEYSSLVEVLRSGVPVSDVERNKWYQHIREIGVRLHEIHVLEGKLQVVGASAATNALQQYRLQATEVNDMIKLIQPTMDKSGVESITNELFRRKDLFYQELARAFKKI